MHGKDRLTRCDAEWKRGEVGARRIDERIAGYDLRGERREIICKSMKSAKEETGSKAASNSSPVVLTLNDSPRE